MPNTISPITHHLSDYQPSLFSIHSIYLTFDLSPNKTRIINSMNLQRKGEDKTSQLILNGENIKLLSVSLEGVLLTRDEYQVTKDFLILTTIKDRFSLEIETEVYPQNNTSLNGLYRTSGNYCTQCEAEGFRNITYYLDRPDVLAAFTTKIIADKTDNRVLLSNGNLIDSGSLPDNRHFAVWQDPHLKPCYLFALVAGNLAVVQDTFITQEGRKVDLKIYVEEKNLDKCDHAMKSLKKAMLWDEQRFGLSYDLDIYMIVAVDDFNMGAMENKGLNVFNSKFVLAKPDTATDRDYEGIEAVIAHEYFHNWTGNRITCRDWFQLTLKEGLTVFRDQEFTADMLSSAVKRIEDVKGLRSHQFSEDAGPMSHPVQPQSYIEMNNFYTMTVYEKGAEVVRMYQTLLGREGFRKGMNLYVERHDGQAVTIQSFRQAMSDANEVDLAQMQNWYDQAGTPRLKVDTQYDLNAKKLKICFSQTLNGDNSHRPFLLPIVIGFISSAGESVSVKIAQVSSSKIVKVASGYLLKMTQIDEEFEWESVEEVPVISFLRDFSAPIILETQQSLNELSLLSQYDSNSFVRWESIQSLALISLMRAVEDYQNQQTMTLLSEYKVAFRSVLSDVNLDRSLKSLALSLPDLSYLGEQYAQIPVEAIYEAYQFTFKALAESEENLLLSIYHSLASVENYVYAKDAIAQRKLKNTCLKYLMKLKNQINVGVGQFYAKQNMTDILAALEALSHTDTLELEDCLAGFYQDWSKDSLVMDKWFALQAGLFKDGSLEKVKYLVNHKDFSYTNPNRVRSVLGVFGRANLLGFHRKDGAGYGFLAEQVLVIDKINPQMAARIVIPLIHWKKLDKSRQALMQASLQHVLAAKGISKDVFEIVSKSLVQSSPPSTPTTV